MQAGFDSPSWGPTTNHPHCEENIDDLIRTWSRRDLPLVVNRHDSAEPGSPLVPGHPGNVLVDDVAAIDPDLFITKTVNSAFYGTPNLAEWLQAQSIEQIVLCGIQTDVCVETTARMGGNLGISVTGSLDATRTCDIEDPEGNVIPAETLMQVTAANLQSGGFTRVTSTEDIVEAVNLWCSRSDRSAGSVAEGDRVTQPTRDEASSIAHCQDVRHLTEVLSGSTERLVPLLGGAGSPSQPAGLPR